MKTQQEPPERPPTATAISLYGNNAAVACPCGRVIIVRSLLPDGKGAWKCSCNRWYKGFPENGARITHILVWEPGNDSDIASYKVAAECPHQS